MYNLARAVLTPPGQFTKEFSRISRHSLTILVALVAVHIILIQNLQQAGATVNPDSISIELDENLLTLEAHNKGLVEVLGKLGELAGFKVVLVDNFNDYGPIDLTFLEVPLEQAIKRLVRDTNNIIFYLPGSNRIVQVWLLESDYSLPESESSYADSAVTTGIESNNSRNRSNAVFRLANQASVVPADRDAIRQIQTSLIKILATDQDTLVRARAAIALGKMGDDEAVAALELATQDPESTVRAQSINALGQIGTVRAIDALGGILLDVNQPATSRVIAAQALWKIDGDISRAYLRIGVTDKNDQVRQASARPPPVLTERPISDRLGSMEAE